MSKGPDGGGPALDHVIGEAGGPGGGAAAVTLDGLRELSQRRGVRESTGEVIVDVFGVGSGREGAPD